MRNPAHESSAILHNDVLCNNAYYGPMQKKNFYTDQSIPLEAIKALADKCDLSPSNLAKKSKIAASTVNRQIAGTAKTGFTYYTLNSLAKGAGFKSYEDFIIHWMGNKREGKNLKKSSKPIDRIVYQDCTDIILETISKYKLEFKSENLMNANITLHDIVTSLSELENRKVSPTIALAYAVLMQQ